MKHTPIYFFSAALFLISLTGCAGDGHEPQVSARKDCPEFKATISGLSTRAFNQSWEAGDRIGISGAGRSNICYVTDSGDGSFKVDTKGNQIYFQDESEVIFSAYYPWNQLTEGNLLINADTRNQTGQKTFDFLWAKASGKKDAPDVAFSFSHRMAKVSFTVRPGEGMSYEEVSKAALSLDGVRHSGVFNTVDGSAGVGGDALPWTFSGGVAPSVANDLDKTLTFSLIFFPQKFDVPVAFLAELALAGDKSYSLRANIDFTSANREKDGADAKNEWVAGRQYNLSLTLHKTEISLDRCVINPWNEVKGDDIIVD